MNRSREGGDVPEPPGLTDHTAKRLRRPSVLPGGQEELAGREPLALGVQRRILRPASRRKRS